MWPQKLSYILYTDQEEKEINIDVQQAETIVPLPDAYAGKLKGILPNTDGRGYGFFFLNREDAEASMYELQTTEDQVLKGSILINLYENLLHGSIPPDWFTEQLITYLSKETNTLLYTAGLGYISNCVRLYPDQYTALETRLWELICTHPVSQHRLLTFRSCMHMVQTEESIEKLYTLWENENAPEGCVLSENDFITLSYLLSIYLPEKSDMIIQTQKGRITNPDRQKEYAFISPAVSPCKTRRDSVFNALLLAENRRIEPWAATALAYLNHRTWQKEAIPYIRPALEKSEEVQRTGDIFFPTAWIRSLLSGHQSAEAYLEIEHFFRDHPDFPWMLSNKIRQQADFLYRTNKILHGQQEKRVRPF